MVEENSIITVSPWKGKNFRRNFFASIQLSLNFFVDSPNEHRQKTDLNLTLYFSISMQFDQMLHSILQNIPLSLILLAPTVHEKISIGFFYGFELTERMKFFMYGHSILWHSSWSILKNPNWDISLMLIKLYFWLPFPFYYTDWALFKWKLEQKISNCELNAAWQDVFLLILSKCCH